jgi:hypothetical protein
MTENMIYKYDEKKVRVRTLAATVESGTPLLDPNDSRPAVALSNSGDATKTVTTSVLPIGGTVTSLTYSNPGVGLVGKETTLAYDGTWEFSNVVSSGTTPVPTNTANGVLVYITSGGALTLASATNTAYGRVDYPIGYFKVAGTVPVRIGD